MASNIAIVLFLVAMSLYELLLSTSEPCLLDNML